VYSPTLSSWLHVVSAVAPCCAFWSRASKAPLCMDDKLCWLHGAVGRIGVLVGCLCGVFVLTTFTSASFGHTIFDGEDPKQGWVACVCMCCHPCILCGSTLAAFSAPLQPLACITPSLFGGYGGAWLIYFCAGASALLTGQPHGLQETPRAQLTD
jgi:hypothetical protein